eukprot:TRINITY_DN80117_c0_g1_i1.p1 TRINITY_DN80117_c0_g1~~TRINITY_DN80117_c0_g1_i1.p1  ORF type:complete len:356 (+),score=77.36 TRINITY_DN80117_c0_g1_i1:31-1098(+)
MSKSKSKNASSMPDSNGSRRSSRAQRIAAAVGACIALNSPQGSLPSPAAFAASAPGQCAPESARESARRQQVGQAMSSPSALTATSSLRLRRCARGPRSRTARRLFDSGSFFGVGVPEALVIALLGWFLLGPEELYRLAKKVGGWLGELRTFIGQAASQYESALDDKSTRQAIEGIRQTQQTVTELAGSWRSVTDSLRDPLALSSTFEATYNKFSKKDEKEQTRPKESEKAATTYPDLESKDAEPVKVSAPAPDEEPLEELEKKKAQSRQAASELWYQGDKDKQKGDEPRASDVSPTDAEGWLQRLDRRSEEIQSMVSRLEELRKGVDEDRAAIRQLVPASGADTQAVQSDLATK